MSGKNSSTILTIDDDYGLRRLIRSFLELNGFKVIQAENGKKGLEVFQREHPELVLVDLQMPVMDGMEFLKIFVKKYPEIPVIIISGRGIIEEAIETLRLGAWDYITKPINNAELTHTVSRALERARLLKENRRYREHLEDEIEKRTKQLQARTSEVTQANLELQREVTERKRIAEKLRKFNIDLEKTVEKRTRQLKTTNKELKSSLKRIEEDEEAGRRIQFQLLPKQTKKFGKYEFCRKLLPSMYLSGDFLDYFQIDDQHLGFYIADVSGHGVSSAFVTALLKSFMDQYQDQFERENDTTILDPAKTLQKLNKDILDENLEKYLTIYYGVIQQNENKLTHCNAGHFPYPILFEKEKATFLKIKGSPVGLFESSTYQNEELNLPEKFLLLLVSDGILEFIETDDLQEKQKYLASVVDHLDLSLSQILKKLKIGDQMSRPDDVTLLSVKRRQ